MEDALNFFRFGPENPRGGRGTNNSESEEGRRDTFTSAQGLIVYCARCMGKRSPHLYTQSYTIRRVGHCQSPHDPCVLFVEPSFLLLHQIYCRWVLISRGTHTLQRHVGLSATWESPAPWPSAQTPLFVRWSLFFCLFFPFVRAPLALHYCKQRL